jgi:general secretion pathway protein F
MRYAYKAQSVDGRVIQGQLDAVDSSDLVKQLAQRGAIPLSLSKLDQQRTFAFRRRSLDPQCLTNLLTELAVMLKSGFPLDEALSLACHGLPASASTIVKLIRDDLIAGLSLSQAFERYPNVIPSDLVAMTRIGEATGNLHIVFASIALERDRTSKLAGKVRGAISYPIFLMVSAFAVLLFFLLHVIPQFSTVFDDAKGTPGGLVESLMNVSKWLLAHELGMLSAAILCGFGGFFLWRHEATHSHIVSGLLKLPVIAKIWNAWRTSRFLAGLALLLGQGVGADEALKILRDSIGADARLALEAAHNEIRRGSRVSEALSKTGLFDSLVERMLKIGEETGQMPKLAEEAAALYARNLEKRLDIVTSVLGPAAILFIALLIGGIMVVMMTALISFEQAAF